MMLPRDGQRRGTGMYQETERLYIASLARMLHLDGRFSLAAGMLRMERLAEEAAGLADFVQHMQPVEHRFSQRGVLNPAWHRIALADALDAEPGRFHGRRIGYRDGDPEDAPVNDMGEAIFDHTVMIVSTWTTRPWSKSATTTWVRRCSSTR